ncbi:hypothetical protein TSTA_098020 [Talaromyces stipitatus ATCC 10500]|uniref:Zn(2)-C6 fungal-type domain-containing protein n=1 Tax=Talaromyces stipitatus (strain ATCC 10500 / CBS 375.48 / QM 6759 / NRRL 1006) TaxID=441959 RepID=B8MM34_TALSN|nr:uncharacterized protein TSTA_098020 [Talaromyces stipitatus ATCC 10500]EED13546.1 hypothetical protein TSTA_098020 [Talaromyces stipitatus ATCC 10500]
MRLKRGIERESCDFCYRRKIKCDRASRATQGLVTCSQCALRQVQCRLDDSDDIRIQRRRRTGTPGRTLGSPKSRPSQRRQVLRGEQQTPGANPVEDESDTSYNTLGSSQPVDSLSPPPPPFSVDIESSFTSPAEEEINASMSLQDETTNFLFLDSALWLSADSVSFLDQVFMRDCELPLEDNQLPLVVDQNQSTSATEGYADGRSKTTPTSVSQFDHGMLGAPWLNSNLDSDSFEEALHAYFDFAALCLPILLEDAFWEDYRAGRCSFALLFAIACRGIPFTNVVNKWEVQQQLAHQFREAFFETQNWATNQGSIRLDDLEALALMVNFEYDNTQNASAQTHLGHLFLTHDSLVLMTLQSRIQSHSFHASASATALARANERRTLLFWHVYGLDAFHSLDNKSISRIQEDDVDLTESLPRHEAGSYLDAMLTLSVIARKSLKTLCGASARRRGVKMDDIQYVYHQLDHWRNTSCPPHLQRQRAKGSNRVFMSGKKRAGKHALLHAAVLWLLELNCYMQIESCVTQYVGGEMITCRVGYETLRAVFDIVDISVWAKQDKNQDNELGQKSLVDLAPQMVRNICAGACFWICLRGKATFDGEVLNVIQFHTIPGRRNREDMNLRKTTMENYLRAAKLLREAVATAISHKDTEQVLTHIDKPIALLEEDIHTLN